MSALPKPTDEAIREYLGGYYDQSADYDRFKIKRIFPSGELNAKDAEVYVEYSSGDCEVVRWTLWLEDDGDGARPRVYGEY